jgi:hypothetical protein
MVAVSASLQPGPLCRQELNMKAALVALFLALMASSGLVVGSAYAAGNHFSDRTTWTGDAAG